MLGYARVSTSDQTVRSQVDALRGLAACGSNGSRTVTNALDSPVGGTR
ncbi:recombinase family protein [Mycolicibacterium hodleri]